MTKKVELRDENGVHVGTCQSVGTVYSGNRVAAVQLKGLVLDGKYVMDADLLENPNG